MGLIPAAFARLNPAMRRWILAGLCMLALGGCVSPGDVNSSLSPSGAAGRTGTIIVYRPEGAVLTRGEPPYILIGGKRYGTLPAGRFIEAQVPEGDVTVTVQQAVLLVVPTIPRSVEVTVIPSSISYVRADQTISSADFEGGATVNQQVSIREVAAAEAQVDVAKLRRLQ